MSDDVWAGWLTKAERLFVAVLQASSLLQGRENTLLSQMRPVIESLCGLPCDVATMRILASLRGDVIALEDENDNPDPRVVCQIGPNVRAAVSSCGAADNKRRRTSFGRGGSAVKIPPKVMEKHARSFREAANAFAAATKPRAPPELCTSAAPLALPEPADPSAASAPLPPLTTDILAPSAATFCDWIRSQPEYSGQLMCCDRRAARSARLVPLESSPLSESLCGAVSARGIAQLYSHQDAALRALSAGEHVVLCTAHGCTRRARSLLHRPTSPRVPSRTRGRRPGAESRSSTPRRPCRRCSTTRAPARCSSSRQRRSRGTDTGPDPDCDTPVTYPLQALAQDQLRSLEALAEAAGCSHFLAASYDGDTAQVDRPQLRQRAHAFLTNPDMLHASVLPQHAEWASVLRQLKLVVVDEAHAYHGVFGSHVGLVLRRLRRICAKYGSRPRFVCCSATIANPLQHAARLLGLAEEELALVGAEQAGPRARTHTHAHLRFLERGLPPPSLPLRTAGRQESAPSPSGCQRSCRRRRRWSGTSAWRRAARRGASRASLTRLACSPTLSGTASARSPLCSPARSQSCS